MADRPNFVIVMTDQQQGYQLGCMGHPDVKTPHVDTLASQGALFERAYTPNPVCMPARMSLVTGLTPRGHGVFQNGSRPRRPLATIPGILRDAGYRTHAVGKIHLEPANLPPGFGVDDVDPADFPEARPLWMAGRIEKLPLPYYGFETVDFSNGHGSGVYGEYLTWLREQDASAEKLLHEEGAPPPHSGAYCSFRCALPKELHYNHWVADRTIAFLKDAARRDEPFFTWVNFPDPHAPWEPVAPYHDMYDRGALTLPVGAFEPWATQPASLAGYFRNTLSPDWEKLAHTEKDLREVMAMAYGMITHVDDEFGRIMAALDETGLRSNTVVVFMSDHGELMGAHGLIMKGPYLYEELARVPFVMSCPGARAQGRKVTSVVSMLDLPRTVLELSGCAYPATPWQEAAAIDGLPEPLAGRSLAPILSGEADRVRERALCEFDEDSSGRAARIRLRCLVTERYKLNYFAGEEYGEIFDLIEDPGEQRNLWHEPAAWTARDDLMAQLAEEIIMTEPWVPWRITHC